MRRMLAAIGLAVLLHCLLFMADVGWLLDSSVAPRVSHFVTVTMSYRQKPQKTANVEQEEEVLPRKILESKKKPSPQVRKKPEVQKPLKPQPSRSEEPRTTGEEKAADAASSTKDSSSDTGRVQEAIPLYRINPPPRYPRTARRRGIQGAVVLSVYVDTQGHVENLWVFESSGYRVLDNAALDSVKKWSFEPGRRGDTAVAMWVNVPVRFELE